MGGRCVAISHSLPGESLQSICFPLLKFLFYWSIVDLQRCVPLPSFWLYPQVSLPCMEQKEMLGKER